MYKHPTYKWVTGTKISPFPKALFSRWFSQLPLVKYVIVPCQLEAVNPGILAGTSPELQTKLRTIDASKDWGAFFARTKTSWWCFLFGVGGWGLDHWSSLTTFGGLGLLLYQVMLLIIWHPFFSDVWRICMEHPLWTRVILIGAWCCIDSNNTQILLAAW